VVACNPPHAASIPLTPMTRVSARVMLFSRLRPIRPQVEHRDHIDSCAALCRVPEECPEEVDAIINACRRLDATERPTALEVCSVIENSAPRRPESAPSGMQEGTHTLSVGGGEL
jgi:hypothetical protein